MFPLVFYLHILFTLFLEKNSDKIVPFQEKTSSLYSIDEAIIDEQVNNIIKNNIQ